jgi:hypothetical protein
MTTETAITSTSRDSTDQANRVAAALLAGGIGCLAMGIVTTLSEALKPVADMLNLYKPTGPLSGKSLAAIVVWLAAWAALSRMAHNRQINVGKWITGSMICVGLGFVATFPLFFDLFGEM